MLFPAQVVNHQVTTLKDLYEGESVGEELLLWKWKKANIYLFIFYLIAKSVGDELIFAVVPGDFGCWVSGGSAQDDGISSFDVDVRSRPHEDAGR